MIKKEKISQRETPKDYNLLIVQDLRKAHYRILLIISLKEFTKLNEKANVMIKNVKLAELNRKIVTVFLNTKVLTLFSLAS